MKYFIFTMFLTLAPSLTTAAGGVVTDPAGIAPDRYVYYPGTEALAEDEIRIIACIEDQQVIAKILGHVQGRKSQSALEARAPPDEQAGMIVPQSGLI